MSFREAWSPLAWCCLLAQLALSQVGMPAADLAPPRAFVENRGQWSNGALFQMRRGNSVVAVQRDGFTIQMLRVDREDGREDAARPVREVTGYNAGLRFVGANPQAAVMGLDPLPGVHNWLRGSDPAKWVTKVPGFARVRIEELYPGIDLELYERDGYLEYDLLLEPGSSPGKVLIEALGVEGLARQEDGSLILHTPWQDVRHSAAICVTSDGSAVIAEVRQVAPRRATIDLHGWNGSTSVRIDPKVEYATYLGGSNSESPRAVRARAGVVAISGATFSWDFPTSEGAFQTIPAGYDDAFASVVSAEGRELVFSTLVGGLSSDIAQCVDMSADGLVFIAGESGTGLGFPTTSGAHDTSPNGLADGFVTRLSADGSSLLFSTLMGGGDNDSIADVCLAPDASIHVTGLSESPDFPTTPGAHAQRFSSIFQEAFIARLSADGSQLLSSTFLGCVASTKGHGLDLDSEGNVYLTGRVTADIVNLLPVTPGAYDPLPHGEVDSYVAKFTPDLSSIVYCTYLGGEWFDEAWGLDVDDSGAAYVTGITDSNDFPVTPGALDTHQDGVQDGFVSKLDPTGSQLVFSTYVGGFGYEQLVPDVAVGPDGSVVVAGDVSASITQFPLTPDAWKSTLSSKDAWLVRLDPAGSTALYGTLMGSSWPDWCRAMALDEQGNAYVAGEAFGPDFPVTPGAVDPTMAGTKDGFVVCLVFGPWVLQGGGLAGASGAPALLTGEGTLEAGTPGALRLKGALPSSVATLAVGLAELAAPFKGGTLVPEPMALVTVATAGSGEALLPWASWPAGVPSGTALWLQAWQADAGGPQGWAASHSLRAVTP